MPKAKTKARKKPPKVTKAREATVDRAVEAPDTIGRIIIYEKEPEGKLHRYVIVGMICSTRPLEGIPDAAPQVIEGVNSPGLRTLIQTLDACKKRPMHGKVGRDANGMLLSLRDL